MIRRALTTALGLAALLTLTASSAQAAPTYQYSPTKSEKLSKTLEEGTAGGLTFKQPRTLTFDSAGNLYLADAEGSETGESIIDKFDDENAFIAQLGAGALTAEFVRGVAVDDETGHIFAGDANHSEVFALDGAGTLLSQWTGVNAEPTDGFGKGCCFIYSAVDNSTSAAHGDVYVLHTTEPPLTEPAGGRVDVFASKNGDLEEGEYLRSLETPPGGFAFSSNDGLAVDDSTGPTAGRVYVADPGHHAVEYFSPTGEFKGKIEGPAPLEPFQRPGAVAVDPATGDLFVADDLAKAVYQFSPTGAPVARIADPGLLEAPISVAIQPTGPNAGDLYVSDLQKKKVDVFALQRPAAPIVEGEGATGVSAGAATLLAELNPQGEATEYRLEYGACPTPSTCALGPYQLLAQGTLGSAGDFSSHTASARLTGLAPTTTYHFRATATNLQDETVGEERTFTTQGAAGLALPDSRGYELVSPPAKHGGIIAGISVGVIEAAADGSAISYLSNSPLEADPEGSSGFGIQVLSTRGSSGWGSRVIASPHRRATGNTVSATPEYRLFAADLSAALIQPFGLFNPELSPEASEQTPYLRTLGSCASSCYRPLLTAADTAGAPFGEELRCEEENGLGSRAASVCGALLLGATPDLSHAVIVSAAPLLAGAPQGESHSNGIPTGSLYEWSRSTGALRLISVLPPNGSGEELPAPPGAELGSLFKNGLSVHNAISTDGSRVFWTSEGNLYLRDTEAGHEQTLELDLAEEACIEAGECESGGGRFQIASADGSRVFFTSTRQLTEDSGAGFDKPDLYECRIEEEPSGRLACALTDLTPETAAGESADVQKNVLGASEDGSYLYFVANGVLAANQGADGTLASPTTCRSSEPTSTCNLYLAHHGALSFLATLSVGDETDWTLPDHQPTRVSPNGRWLAFMSQQPLTGYDNHDAASGRLDAEVFLYDASSGRLRCASCDPTGARPVGIEYGRLFEDTSLATGRGQWASSQWVAALVPQATTFLGTAESAYQSRYLSDSGRLFFNALGGLVPADSNGIGDVYQFEQPQGPGQPASNSCSAADPTYIPASGGCLDLISSGTSKESSSFLDASESGNDVFFLTSQRLTPKDVDSSNDVYDARSGGGEAAIVKPVECSGDACQPPAVPPNDQTPGSLTFNGAGNLLQCPKGKVKKSGKCVAAKKHKAKHHKKKAHKRAAKHRSGK